MVVGTALAVGGLLSAVNAVYSRRPEHRDQPIKGYVQVIRIILYLVTGIIIVATLMDRSPWILLSGLGAMTAVLLLVFKDTVLSLVASIQLTGNKMIRVGDWIEMPQQGVDGDVIDVALHTVKVQNFDKTITTFDADRRRLTNVGTLRHYIVQYLRAHPKIHQEMTLLVRQLAPTPEGLPLEIYTFTNDTGWIAYEDIQSDVFDHILARAPEFGLRMFQKPSGLDLEHLGTPSPQR
jgi:miniconductance mechanosensitive channel